MSVAEEEVRPSVLSPLLPDSRVRFPRRDGGPLEAAVMATNEVLRNDAGSRLDLALPGSVAALAALNDGESRAGFDIEGPLVGVAALWTAIDERLSREGVEPVDLVISTADVEGRKVDIDFSRTYGVSRPDVEQLASTIAAGNALTVRGLDEHLPDLDDLVADLVCSTGQSVRVDAVIIPPGISHVEPQGRIPETLFFLPVNGQARVQVDPDGEDSGRAVEVGTERGLVVAAAKNARIAPIAREDGVDGPVLVLRVAVASAAIEDLALVAWESAKFHPLIRADLPADFGSQVTSYDGSIIDDQELRVAEFTRLLGPDALLRAASRMRAAVPPRRRLSLTAAVGHLRDGLPERMHSCVPTGVGIIDEDGHLRLVAGSMVLTLEESLAEWIVTHLNNRDFSVASTLEVSPDPEACMAVLRDLYREGLIVPCSTSS